MFKKKPLRYFFYDHNNVMDFIMRQVSLVSKIQEADVVVLWTDTTPDTRMAIDYARKYKKKTVVMQHGRRGSSRYYPPFNFPIYADKILVWGEADKKRLLEAGHPEKKIKVVGTTVLLRFNEAFKEKHEGINIVFCPEHWDKEVEENKKVSDLLKDICKRNKWNLTTKLIQNHNGNGYQNPVYSNTDDENHLDIVWQVLKTADVVVGISESTFELIAQKLNIPVVIVDEWIPKTFGGDERYLTYPRIISKASAKAKYDNLEEVIKQTVDNPGLLQKERYDIVKEEGGDFQFPEDEILRELQK